MMCKCISVLIIVIVPIGIRSIKHIHLSFIMSCFNGNMRFILQFILFTD